MRRPLPIHYALAFSVALSLAAPRSAAETPAELAPLGALYPELDRLYQELHQHPELSGDERQTAARLAKRLRALGFEVTTGVGKHGVVGVLKNGKGPTVMLRTELDGLPIEEKTGLPYASRVKTVMHACGHDIHMTSWVGAATLLARSKHRWRGTLVMVGQPAEETVTGARAMLADGLFTRFPRPDFAIAVHVKGDLAAGSLGWVAGPATANMDSVDVRVHGRGGHGSRPQETIDPVLIAARIVVTLQSIVAREVDPREPAVVTVGSIHGGTKHNIIPDEAQLQITLRSYSDPVRRHLVEAVKRISLAEAAAANARPPEVRVTPGVSSVVNDPVLTARLVKALTPILGAERVREARQTMGAEDFSEYGRAGVPLANLWIGASRAEALEAAAAGGPPVPSSHSSAFAPVREPTLRAATTVLAASALELFARP
jgi:hippurate hydrolase